VGRTGDKAVPACFDETGRIVPKSRRQGFAVCHWGTKEPVLGQTNEGMVFALYPAPMMPAHIGCQTVPPGEWLPILRVLGGFRSFPYMLREVTP
jgi:hypothetical protein